MPEWEETTLERVAEVLMGQSPPGHTYNTNGLGLPFLQGSAEFGEHVPTPVKWCSAPAKIAEPGDLMVSVRAPVGDSNFADQRIAVGRGLAVIRARPETTNGYLRLVIQQSTADLLARSGTGMFSSITGKELRTFRFLLPPPREQRRIIDLMSSVDAQIEALETESKAAWSLLARLREEFFTAAPQVPLERLCSIKAPLVDPRLEEHADLLHIGVEQMEKGTGRILGPRTAREDGLISTKYLFEAGDVVYSKIRPALRKVSVPGFRALCSADAYPLTPEPDVPAALLREALLHEPVVETVIGMSGRTKMPKVNRKELFSVEVPMPPVEDRPVVDSALLSTRQQAVSLDLESDALRALRSTLLTSLLNRASTIPESYDDMLVAVS